MTNGLINRNTKTITFSLPPEALRNYMEEREWLRTVRYERLKARQAEQEESRRTA